MGRGKVTFLVSSSHTSHRLAFSVPTSEENRSRSRHNVEGFFCRCTIFRPSKPAFFRYNENFTLVRDFYVAYFVIPEISKNN